MSGMSGMIDLNGPNRAHSDTAPSTLELTEWP